MIELETVVVEGADRRRLDDVTLTAEERRIGIIGGNGSGKSTFLRLLNGLLRPTSGTVRVFGRDTSTETAEVRRRVGFLFQNPDNQIVMPTVGEDVAFGLARLKLPAAEVKERVRSALARHGMAEFQDRLVHELSGGERQLVALAGILVMEPSLLVLDEPTTLLDRRNKRRLMAEVEAADRPVVLATHDLDLLKHFDRVIVFDAGRIVADGSPATSIAAYEAATS